MYLMVTADSSSSHFFGGAVYPGSYFCTNSIDLWLSLISWADRTS